MPLLLLVLLAACVALLAAVFVLLAGATVSELQTAVTGGRAALTALENGDVPLSDQILQRPEEHAALGLIAELAADVVAVEGFREAGDRRLEILQETVGPSLGRGFFRRPGWRGGRSGRREGLLGEHAPGQIQGVHLEAMGGLQQVDAGAQLRIELAPPLIVVVACHDAGDCITTNTTAQPEQNMVETFLVKRTSSFRGFAGWAALALFLALALPETLANVMLHFDRGRERMHLSSLAARSDVLGTSYVRSLQEIRHLIPEEEDYFLVDAGTAGESSPLWVRYELAPRRAVLLGPVDALKRKDLRKVRRSSISWVVIAYPSGTPARALPRDEFAAELAGRLAR